MKRDDRPILVVGAGGAGMIAAWRAASLGAKVLLLERNKKPGIKLLISGGGKCNVTHAGLTEDLLSAFEVGEARFLKPSFFRFRNSDLLQLLGSLGVKTVARPNGRVFPLSNRADDVVEALEICTQAAGVQMRLNSRVTALVRTGSTIMGASVDNELISSDYVILATGGVSYPRTGTSGDGLTWAAEAGHTIVPLRPALAPIGVVPPLPVEWRGVAIRRGRLSIVSKGQTLISWDDDIMFSHEGITGPAALEVSRQAAIAKENGPVLLRFDFFPTKDFAELDDTLNQIVQRQRAKMIGSLLETWLPNRIVPALLHSVGVDPEKRGHTLTREERRTVVHLLKGWTIGHVGAVNIERGEVTAGGVALQEVDPHSMRSSKVSGLYVCGEILDIAGPVGGYNLQAAFSTGYVAGESAATDWLG